MRPPKKRSSSKVARAIAKVYAEVQALARHSGQERDTMAADTCGPAQLQAAMAGNV